MTRKIFIVFLLAGWLTGIAVAPAEARRDERRNDRPSRHEEARRNGVSLDEAVARVRRETGGRVLSAEPRDNRYRIKVLMPNGAVRVVNVDARSGRMD